MQAVSLELTKRWKELDEKQDVCFGEVLYRTLYKASIAI
jgi:hypothetical protein